MQPILHVEQLLRLALHQARDRDAGPARHDLRDVVRVDLLLEQQRAAGASAPAAAPPLGSSCFCELGGRAVAQLGGAGVVGGPLGGLDLRLQALQLLARLADLGDDLLLALPAAPSSRRRARAGRPAPSRAPPGAPSRRRPSPCAAPRARSPAASGAARSRPARRAWSPSPSAAGWRPRRPGRWPCPAGSAR